MGHGGAAEPVTDGVRTEETSADELAGSDIRLLVSGGEEGGHDGSLTVRVVVEIALEAVENCTAETEGLFVVHHRHQEQDDGGPGGDRRGEHRQELLLVRVAASDDLSEGVDGLGEDISRDAAGEEDGGEAGEDAAGGDGGLAAGGDLAGVAGRHQGPHQVELRL